MPRRRPSGEPPPLPHAIGRTGRFWLAGVLYFSTILIVVAFGPLRRAAESWDPVQLRFFAACAAPA